MRKNLDVTCGKEYSLFIKFAVPNIISLILLSSASIVDAAFIGHFVGENSLAAVNIVHPVFSLFWGLSIMVLVGGAVKCGKYLGENNIKDANNIFTLSIVFVAFISFILMILLLTFSENIVRLLGANDTIADTSKLYLETITPFVAFITMGYGLSVFARVDGFPFIASFALTLGALINIILDYIFIIQLDFGVKGAGYATGLSYITGFIILIIHFIKRKGRLFFNVKIYNIKELLTISANGFSEFINELSIGLIAALFNRIMINSMGESGVAAFTAVNYTLLIGNMINYATADSLNSLVSVNYGAGLFSRIRKFIYCAGTLSLVNAFILITAMTLIPDKLTGIFINNVSSSAYSTSIEFMWYVKWALILSGLNMILSSYFTSIHKPKQSAVIALLRSLILPAVLLYTLPYFFGSKGIYTSIPISEALTFIAGLTLLFMSRKIFLQK